jgi:hypothetical protein
MADGKALHTPERRARDSALSAVLDAGGLLPDLIRLIRSYDSGRAYRWRPVGKARRCDVHLSGRPLRHSAFVFVSADGDCRIDCHVGGQ